MSAYCDHCLRYVPCLSKECPHCELMRCDDSCPGQQHYCGLAFCHELAVLGRCMPYVAPGAEVCGSCERCYCANHTEQLFCDDQECPLRGEHCGCSERCTQNNLDDFERRDLEDLLVSRSRAYNKTEPEERKEKKEPEEKKEKKDASCVMAVPVRRSERVRKAKDEAEEPAKRARKARV